MGFTTGSAVVVEEVDDVNWKVERKITYNGQHDTFVVPVGMDTDFASVPRVFVWFLPRYGRYTKAAILHDYLWRRKVPDGAISIIEADALFRRAMRELGVPFLRRWIMWAAVRWGALLKPHGRVGWWREAWRVLLVTLLALPIVLPPAVLIVAALAVFFVLEWITWTPLAVHRRVSTARGHPPRKQVNKPRFDWKSSS